MNLRLTIVITVTGILAVVPVIHTQQSPQRLSLPRSIEPDPATGGAAAVIVDDSPLVHTAQLWLSDGESNPRGDAANQLNRLLSRLQSVLHSAGSDLDRVVKLNVYVTQEDAAPNVWKTLAARFAGKTRPAISLVVTPLPDSGALVALDAVALAGSAVAAANVRRLEHATVLPPGSRIYVSGQAAPGTLREATRKTLEGLTATLKHCGRSDQDIVQLKCFLRPMDSVAEVQEEIVRHYGQGKAPPVSFVEWRSTLPIEIELVAWGGPARSESTEALEFLTLPGMSASPLFSRVARIHRGGTIYFSDLFGPPQAAADEQVQAAFERLRSLLEKTGSDLTHLAKATYYVTDDEISKAHNTIRPKFFNPQRPPAASKALIGATGRPGVRYTMDMIAVPVVGKVKRP